MGGMGLVGVGGPGGRSEHNGLDPLASTVHEWTYDAAEYASFIKRLVKGQALFSAPPEREKTTWLIRSRVRSFWENRAQNAASLPNFCAQCVALVAFFRSGRTGPWEHSETLLHHDERGE
jgi:hypothetical protein